MKKIKYISRLVISVVNISLFLFPLWILSIWIFIDSNFIKELINVGVIFEPIVNNTEGLIELSKVTWQVDNKLLGMLSSVIGVLPLFISLFILKCIFKNYQNGNIFILDNSRYYKNLGVLFLLNAIIARPLSLMLIEIAATFHNTVGHRYLTLSFGMPNIKHIFIGILAIIISWVMLEGSKINEEIRHTV